MPLFPLAILVGGIVITGVITIILLMAERNSRDS